MKVFKYILFIILVLILWITEPLWFKKSYKSPNKSTPDVFIEEQDIKRKEVLKAQLVKVHALEEKFGPKPSAAYGSGIPPVLAKHWKKVLKYPDSLTEELCGPIRESADGWQVVCRYRVKNSTGNLELRQDTYIIKNGVVVK